MWKLSLLTIKIIAGKTGMELASPQLNAKTRVDRLAEAVLQGKHSKILILLAKWHAVPRELSSFSTCNLRHIFLGLEFAAYL